jgi:hypothetical protein
MSNDESSPEILRSVIILIRRSIGVSELLLLKIFDLPTFAILHHLLVVVSRSCQSRSNHYNLDD